MVTDDRVTAPSLGDICELRARLGEWVRETPVWEWKGGPIEQELPPRTRVFIKLELFQFAGSFKPRGALAVMMALAPAQLAKGVTAVSAGNHAMAAA
jgi:threonine dehydratase